jgi:hypothetical protein
MNILLAETIRELALENLRTSGAAWHDEHELGKALLAALEQAGVDLMRGPSLEETKSLLTDVARLARDGEAAAASMR